MSFKLVKTVPLNCWFYKINKNNIHKEKISINSLKREERTAIKQGKYCIFFAEYGQKVSPFNKEIK